VNLNQTGLYLYATYTSKQECLVKVGMAKDQTIEKRIKDHVSSAGGLELFGAIAIQKGRVKSAEDKLIKIMKAEFGEAYSGTETFLVPSPEYVLELLETSEFRRQIETTFEYTESKTVEYKYNSLYGEADVRDNRPPCYFLEGESAMITTEAGTNEKYRTVTVYKDRHANWLPNPKRVHISDKVWNILKSQNKPKEENNIITVDKFYVA